MELIEKLKKDALEDIGIATYGGQSFEATGMYRDKIYKVLDTLIEKVAEQTRGEEREKEADNGYRCRKNTAESVLIKIRAELKLKEGESVMYAIKALTTPPTPLPTNTDTK